MRAGGPLGPLWPERKDFDSRWYYYMEVLSAACPIWPLLLMFGLFYLVSKL